ncbi:ammonia-dependent NAD(+) synthetase [Canibacter sp. lx-45]|uniref:ammonia-dependent NAD(+) synthetase n=1 Tax=Canibacter zhuwentaonis TaxID=2837491 RepID=UPI001BDD6289|nr:ammonia-dependent NAD(+) synthetase [Canibacter zhuwentaonis]
MVSQGSLRAQIIAELGVRRRIDPPQEVCRRVQFLQDYLLQTGARGYVLGISGGQDSTLAGRLAQLAVAQLRETTGADYCFYAVRLPYGRQFDEVDARLALEFIAPDRVLTVDIKPGVDALAQGVAGSLQASGVGAPVTDFNRGNIKARARMVAQYAIAAAHRLLVIGTDHAAEAVTGFFTKYGDGAADLMPLHGLTKSQGAQLLRELGAPDRTWLKAPTADLLDDNPGQLDEDSLGVSYTEIDAYLMGEEVAQRVIDTIEGKFISSRHKRNSAAHPDNDWWLQ